MDQIEKNLTISSSRMYNPEVDTIHNDDSTVIRHQHY
jgi:hypothetical protein